VPGPDPVHGHRGIRRRGILQRRLVIVVVVVDLFGLVVFVVFVVIILDVEQLGGDAVRRLCFPDPV